MVVIQTLLLLVFGLPLVVLCLAFFLGAMWLQMCEDQRLGEKRGLSERT